MRVDDDAADDDDDDDECCCKLLHTVPYQRYPTICSFYPQPRNCSSQLNTCHQQQRFFFLIRIIKMVKTKELDPYIRAKLEAGVELGHSITTLSKFYKVPRPTIYDTFRLREVRDRQKTRPRPGRPRKLTERDKNHIIILIKRNPFIKYPALKEICPTAVSIATIRRLIQGSGYGNWPARKRPELTPTVAEKRWAFVKQAILWTKVQRESIIWTDECSVELGKGKRREYCFRLNYLNEKYKKEYVQPFKKSRGVSVMTFGPCKRGIKTAAGIQFALSPMLAWKGEFDSANWLEKAGPWRFTGRAKG
ncbi:Homeodomain-like protein [Ascosphaera apis ARSEF 7405]|uniref:Homeodomain-like protein n=1 Tax=Ascosphaera apis ARSEF 7405 TaxID=392613 RepID=A0A166NL04_9EURO|nr:Homeodomain-like protein [Ascosphaera apis ARSEF 7405]